MRAGYSNLASRWQAPRHPRSLFSGVGQPDEDPHGDSFLFGYPLRCRPRGANRPGQPEIADSTVRIQDSEVAAKMARCFLRCNVRGHLFAGDIWCRCQRVRQSDRASLIQVGRGRGTIPASAAPGTNRSPGTVSDPG